MTGGAEIVPTGPDERILDMGALVVTRLATAAHNLVVEAGREHFDSNDHCATLGIGVADVEKCPEYREADALYSMLLHRGQKGAAH